MALPMGSRSLVQAIHLPALKAVVGEWSRSQALPMAQETHSLPAWDQPQMISATNCQANC